jgi:hypothetical protein
MSLLTSIAGAISSMSTGDECSCRGGRIDFLLFFAYASPRIEGLSFWQGVKQS